MSHAAAPKKWVPALLALVAAGLLIGGVASTWGTLSGGGTRAGEGKTAPAPEVRISADPSEPPAPNPAKTATSNAPSMEHAAKPPSTFGLPQFPDTFDFHSMEAKTKSGKTPIGSSAFLIRKAKAAEVAQFYLLELGKEGWELLWQREARIHPNNDKHRAPLTGTRLRWLDRTHRKQLTLLALDDPQPKHSAQAVVSWAALPGPKAAAAE